MTRLYQIAETYRNAAVALEDMELDPQVIADTLESIGGDLQVKSTNVAMVVRNIEVSMEAIDAAIDEMKRRKQILKNRSDNIRDYLKQSMETAGITKIECPYFVLAIKKNPPSVVVDDADAIPDSYMRVPDPPPAEIDKKAIAEALKAGTEVPGAHLETRTRLDIR